MFEVGRMCVKIAGRDAGQKCVIVSVLDDKTVLVDGMTRRRKCNKIHLEPLNKVLDIKDNATHEEVAKAFKSIDLEVKVKKAKAKTEKPKAVKKAKPKAEGSSPKKEKKAKAKAEKTSKKSE